MYLTEKHLIKKNDPRFKDLLELCRLSNNLYNATLYDIRQHFFATGKYKGFYKQRPEFSGTNPDYVALPAKVAGEVMQDVHSDFKSFFQLLKKKQKGEYDKNVKIPKYKSSGGIRVVSFPKDTLSKEVKDEGDGVFLYTLCKGGPNIQFHSKARNIKRVEVIPRHGELYIHVVYYVEDHEMLPDNKRYASVDLGVNNIMSVIFNTSGECYLYNGKPIKSVNHNYNKTVAKLKSRLPQGKYHSRKIDKLGSARDRKIEWYFHNISKYLVNQLVSHNINTLIVGYNKEWKQDINLGKRNNQNFVGIPYLKLINMLKYKCEKVGINLIITEESYTSKCSFLDEEEISKHESYIGKRVKRGMFQTQDRRRINADINAAGNIMRKVVPDSVVYAYGIKDAAVHPRRVVVTTSEGCSVKS